MGLIAIYIIKNGNGYLYYTATDHLGSICQIIEPNGTVIEETNYDPWGRIRIADTWELSTNNSPLSIIYRGYTGHEHLPQFAIINMNGRMYDPVLARMLSPDNYVQSPNNPQNYNRYAYVLNNPLKYTDPSGDMGILDSWINGFVDGFFSTSSNRFETAWENANNAASRDAKIFGALFISDPNKDTKNRIWEVVSRLTWQVPQTTIGFLMTQSLNTIPEAVSFGNSIFNATDLGRVESINYKYGATVVQTSENNIGGMTLGSFIIGGRNIEANENNSLFQHEYGHYLQSQTSGFLYMPKYALTSLNSAITRSANKSHSSFWVEQYANIRANRYFNNNVDNYNGWNYDSNPIFNSGFNNEFDNKYKKNSSIVNPKWYEYGLFILEPGANGFIIAILNINKGI